jgi:hypothetical protein
MVGCIQGVLVGSFQVVFAWQGVSTGPIFILGFAETRTRALGDLRSGAYCVPRQSYQPIGKLSLALP